MKHSYLFFLFLIIRLQSALFEDLENFKKTGTCEKGDLSNVSLSDIIRQLIQTHKKITIKNSNLSGVSFEKAYLKNVKFVEVDLAGVNFSQSFLENIRFIACNLADNTFQRAQINETTFKKGSLVTATFEQAKLSNCSFDKICLADVSFKEAGMYSVNFSKTIFNERISFDESKIYHAVVQKKDKSLIESAKITQNIQYGIPPIFPSFRKSTKGIKKE